MMEYTKQQLFDAARKTGEAMFGRERSSYERIHGDSNCLVFCDDVRQVTLEETSIKMIIADGIADMGEECPAYVDEYEFLFFPSCPGKLTPDVSSVDWNRADDTWKDVDGLIYTAWADGIIRIVEDDR